MSLSFESRLNNTRCVGFRISTNHRRDKNSLKFPTDNNKWDWNDNSASSLSSVFTRELCTGIVRFLSFTAWIFKAIREFNNWFVLGNQYATRHIITQLNGKLHRVALGSLSSIDYVRFRQFASIAHEVFGLSTHLALCRKRRHFGSMPLRRAAASSSSPTTPAGAAPTSRPFPRTWYQS